MSAEGLFIAFEGPEGSGKSTQIRLLRQKLCEEGLEPVVTREPGGTPASDAIRAVLLDPDLSINPLSEFLLYSASRSQHVEEVIAPALQAGRLVISDRFAGASVAYQGYGRGLELSFIHDLTARVTGSIRPHLTILLDLDPAEGLARVAARGQKDRLERADLSFHQRVRTGFLEIARADASWVVLDATQSVYKLSNAVWDAVQARVNE
jgi:dTMP kinase